MFLRLPEDTGDSGSTETRKGGMLRALSRTEAALALLPSDTLTQAPCCLGGGDNATGQDHVSEADC